MRKQSYVSFNDLTQDYIVVVKNISRLKTRSVCCQSLNSTYYPTSPKPHTTFFPALHRSQNAFVHSPVLVVKWSVRVEAFFDVLGPGLRTIALDHEFFLYRIVCVNVSVKKTVLNLHSLTGYVLELCLHHDFRQDHAKLIHKSMYLFQQKAHPGLGLLWLIAPQNLHRAKTGFPFGNQKLCKGTALACGRVLEDLSEPRLTGLNCTQILMLSFKYSGSGRWTDCFAV